MNTDYNIEIVPCRYADDEMASVSISQHNGLYTFVAEVDGRVVKQQYQGYTMEYCRQDFQQKCHEYANALQDAHKGITASQL